MQKLVLLGDEAIAQAALDAGISGIYAYPGTPSTEIMEYIQVSKKAADNNVHPANSLQLIDALQKAGKSIEVQLAPDGGHTALNRDRMMEFFIKHLVMKD